MERKYKLTDEHIQYNGHKLYRIQALKAFKSFVDVKEGDFGGYIESEDNLSHSGTCWVFGNAKVFGNAEVCNNAKIYCNAKVFYNVEVCNNVKIYGNAKVYGNVKIYGNAEICKDTDYIVFKNWWSSGRYFTWTRSNNMWKVGCFYGTGEELIMKAYNDSKESGREYERVVKYVESILADDNYIE